MYIYEIKNTINEKRYIGQTIQSDVRNRWNDHIKNLRKNKHINGHLQRAWNKYGEASFVFSTIKKCISLDELNTLEDRLVAENIACGGYNIRYGGNNKRHSEETKQKMSIIQKHIDRSGWNLKEQGKRLHTKKAIIARQKAKIPNGSYPEIVSPDGKRYTVHNASLFGRKHNISPTLLRAMMAGKYSHCKGWRIATENTINVPFEFYKIQMISPDGDIYIVENLSQFCRDKNLNPSLVCGVLHGRRHHHKGWRAKQLT